MVKPLFVIDDLDQYARAFGIVHDATGTGLADHEHKVRWTVSPREEKPNGAYINIEVWLDCGCEVRDLQSWTHVLHEGAPQESAAVTTSP